MADLEQNKEVLTQRELAQKLGKALGTVNKTMTQLQSLGYAREGSYRLRSTLQNRLCG